MDNPYYNRYKLLKQKYVALKAKLMSGGKRGENSRNMTDCLTSDSMKLIKELEPIMDRYGPILDKFIEPLDKNASELADKIKGASKKKEVKYGVKKIDNVFAGIIKDVNMDRFIEAERRGSRIVFEYLKSNKMGYAFSFIGSDVVEDLQKEGASKELYEIDLDGTTLVLPVMNDELVKEVEMHKQIVSSIADHFGLTFEEPNVVLLMSDAKKFFPSSDKVFTARSVNSAEFDPTINHLSIFRREELSKLLFHELIHRANLEHRVKGHQDVINRWGRKWAINRIDDGDIMFTESFVEVMAQFINIVTISEMCDADFDDLWKNELMFGIYQTAKILYLSGFKTNRDFVTRATEKRVNESTSAAEYHIFKTILMLNFNEFMRLYRGGSIKDLLEMVYDFALNNGDYNEMVDSLILSFDKTNGSDLFRTGRMSIVERDIIQ